MTWSQVMVSNSYRRLIYRANPNILKTKLKKVSSICSNPIFIPVVVGPFTHLKHQVLSDFEGGELGVAPTI